MWPVLSTTYAIILLCYLFNTHLYSHFAIILPFFTQVVLHVSDILFWYWHITWLEIDRLLIRNIFTCTLHLIHFSRLLYINGFVLIVYQWFVWCMLNKMHLIGRGKYCHHLHVIISTSFLFIRWCLHFFSLDDVTISLPTGLWDVQLLYTRFHYYFFPQINYMQTIPLFDTICLYV